MSPAAVSRLVVLGGVSAAAAGVLLLWGLGFALLCLGVSAVLYGLLFIDVKG